MPYGRRSMVFGSFSDCISAPEIFDAIPSMFEDLLFDYIRDG
jgi:hypothetical protein